MIKETTEIEIETETETTAATEEAIEGQKDKVISSSHTKEIVTTIAAVAMAPPTTPALTQVLHNFSINQN